MQFLQTGRGIPFSQMFVMKEYPRDILPLYAQGHSLSSLLIAKGGKRKFLDYIGEGSIPTIGSRRPRSSTASSRWATARNLARLGPQWQPGGECRSRVLLVSNESSERPRVLRGQSPDSVRGEPNVIAPLVAIQRPNRGAAQVGITCLKGMATGG